MSQCVTKLVASKEIKITIPQSLYQVMMGMALLEGETDTKAWISRYASDTLKKDIEACLMGIPDNPLLDVEKVRWALSR